jgi:hypothetical protein
MQESINSSTSLRQHEVRLIFQSINKALLKVCHIIFHRRSSFCNFIIIDIIENNQCTDGLHDNIGTWRSNFCNSIVRATVGQQQPNPSAPGVDVKEDQGGNVGLGWPEWRPLALRHPGHGVIDGPLQPLATIQSGSMPYWNRSGRLATRPNRQSPPTRDGHGRRSGRDESRISASASDGAWRWLAREHAELKRLLRHFGDRIWWEGAGRARACRVWRQSAAEWGTVWGTREGSQQAAGRWGGRWRVLLWKWLWAISISDFF